MVQLITEADKEGMAVHVHSEGGGEELASQSYPIKSFFDAGACPVFHSDYPVSPSFSIQHSIYMAQTRIVATIVDGEEVYKAL